ncbi:uncharacterized protein LOC125675952 [Ostrea edulis]|uniref:uncharacterized protein LOC125675952 n=1 Tax=Ostrea edulis TaxID=37623 RepID=UPI0020962189|nr:uncharacterized protein LOC125675952 [Ostrea edulis]
MSTERINLALATLRNEMNEIRSQDVTIMKQLISLNSTLKEMNKFSTKTRLNRNSSRRSLEPLSRKSSMDSLLSASTDSLNSTNSDDSNISMTSRILPSAVMTLPNNETELSESQYRGILMTNIKLWKLSQNDDTSSIYNFSDQEGDV